MKIQKYYFGLAILFSVTLFVMNKIKYCGSVWGDINSNFIDMTLYFSDMFFLIMPLQIYSILKLIGRYIDRNKMNSTTQYSRKNKHQMLLIWFLITYIVWTCIYLSYYPRGIYSDTLSSIDMAMTGNILQNHHPILYTLLIQQFIRLGMDIMGKDLTWSLGMFCLTQMAIMGYTVLYFLN